MIRLRARWIFPGDGPPLPNAVLEVHARQVVSVQTDSAERATDLGNVALIPGLINAHTHLEFSDLTVPVEPRERFADWIAAVISSRRERPVQQLESAHAGISESVRSGVIGIAETATSDWIFENQGHLSLDRLLVFREVLGLREEAVIAGLDLAQSFLNRAQAKNIDCGLSPHAPYSMHPKLFRGLCHLAASRKIPLSMHLAESPAELELLRSGTGPLVELFTRMGIWKPGTIPLGTRPLDYLKELSQAPRVLVVHGNLMDEEEINFLSKQPHMSVVWCPRTFSAMQTGVHPWQSMIRKKIRVAIGTDSRASNPDLKVWEELRHLSQLVPAETASSLLSLATRNAAQALGWDDVGTIAPGQQAAMNIIHLSPDAVEDPERFLFHPEHVPQPLRFHDEFSSDPT